MLHFFIGWPKLHYALCVFAMWALFRMWGDSHIQYWKESLINRNVIEHIVIFSYNYTKKDINLFFLNQY